MAKFLLDYVFKVSAVTPTPEASTGFLKQACVVCKPKAGVDAGSITACTTAAAIAALTDNDEAEQLLNAGMAKVFILLANDLDLADTLEGANDFYTLLVSSDFEDENVDAQATLQLQNIVYEAVANGAGGNDITIEYTDSVVAGSEAATVVDNAITVAIESGVSTTTQIAAAIAASADATALVTATIDAGEEATAQVTAAATNLAGGTAALDDGTFDGVVGLWNDDTAVCATNAAVEKQCGFYGNATNKAKNMMYAFGKLLSNSLNWVNQQYITMPLGDGIASLGDAESLFDDKVSFVITDDEYSHRLALFAVGAKAIVAPYITRNLEINLQSEALSFISGNTPAYTKKYATLLENQLNDTIQDYIDRGWIEAGTVEVKLEQNNFVASGYINISEPNALWRVFAEMRQTL